MATPGGLPSELSTNRKLADYFRLARDSATASKVSGNGSPARNFRFYLCPGSCLPRKYVCGVVPSIVRNISMKALTLS